MRTFRHAVAGVILALGCAGAPAAGLSGRTLLEACGAPAGSTAAEPCAGWAEWVTMSPYFCPPEDLEPAVVTEQLVRWLTAHPGKLHMPGGALVQEAFVETYPCRRGR